MEKSVGVRRSFTVLRWLAGLNYVFVALIALFRIFPMPEGTTAEGMHSSPLYMPANSCCRCLACAF